MKSYVAMILLFALTSKAWAQHDSITAVTEYKDDIDALFEQISYRVGMGLFIPASNEFFRVGLLFEFNANIPISTYNSIELAFQFGGWDRENNFNYVRRLEALKGTSSGILNGIIKYKKDVIFLKNSFVSIGGGIGISTIFITTEAYIFEESLENAPFENMTSLLLVPELEYVFNVTERTQFSLSVSVLYADYKLKSALQNNIGKWYYLPKITYRF